ncbi:hypothetical protein P1J78_18700 [Psychromarinibacter sp. C21-152]|uniref:Uncharacterized protein n=1 Tax=Psychromarinibacter sediminicola TaxID=3033385 RepID=A0AAE3NXI7_9RHOB|nr:hypothetical protein [Psychromarinibacter sediminicola]MDF0602775.1 hypothetical protein [Psychromarinibacter sediminicola]
MADAPELFGRGLYRRDTPFTAGGAQGADLVTLLLILPAALSALFGPLTRPRRLVLAVALSWTLYLGVSLSFGAVAFNEAFPLYVLMMPMSALGLALALRPLPLPRTPRWLPGFLLACGVVTGGAWSLLLWLEMTSGAYPPQSYYTVRTTYALDLGLIAPGCVAAAVGLRRGRSWGMLLAIPLLAIAALLLPMMLSQTVMQLRAGAALGPEAVAPLAGFALVSAGAAWFLWRLARGTPAHTTADR